MKIADKYILKEFIKGFLLSLIGLLAIFIIVDVFEQISKFVDKEVPVLVIIQYYFYLIPWIIGTTISPIACLLGCFISIGNLSRYFELAALKFSGLSPYRILLPLLIAGLILSGLTFGLNETLMPLTNQKKLLLEEEKINKRPERALNPSKNIYYSGKDNRFYRIKFIDPKEGIIQGLTIYEFSSGHTLEKRFDAPKAVWKDDKWELFNGSERIFKTHSFEDIYFNSLVLNIREKPLDFVKLRKPPLSMGFFEFKRHIENLQRGGEDITKELVDLWTRISFPFMNLIVILLGFPLATKVRNIGFIIGFASALFVSFIYWGLMQLAKAFGHTGTLSPVLASVLPNLFFIIAGAFLLWKLRK